MRVLKDKSPSTVGVVQKLLGFVIYYRTFIHNFSRIMKLLYKLHASKGEKIATKDTNKTRWVDTTWNADSMDTNKAAVDHLVFIC